MSYTIAYWDIRGLAQAIRFLLEYVGADYEDKRYVVGPDNDRSSWTKVKPTLGLDFPNLPYYMDKDVKLTQSQAILRYLARKYNLYGNGLEEKAEVDLLMDCINDMRVGFVRLCYGPPPSEERKNSFIGKAKESVGTFEKYLGTKQFFLGDKVTVCDFPIYEVMDHHRIYDASKSSSILADAPNITAYMKRFEELPAIQKYLNSDKFKARPLNNPSAHFK